MSRTATQNSRAVSVPKTPTGIPGFDSISEGGLPSERATLIAGTAGSAKTVFAVNYLAAGIVHGGENGVFVTFEDSVADVRKNMQGFGWDIALWEKEGKWAFVDAAPDADDPIAVVGDYDLSGLLARIQHAVRRINAKRVSLDSLNALFVQFKEHALLRAELFRITSTLKKMGVTVVFTGERIEEYGQVTRYGIEEFVADNVVILRNILDEERRRRTVEILKMRGTHHQRGEFPFTITSRGGIVVIPLSQIELTTPRGVELLTTVEEWSRGAGDVDVHRHPAGLCADIGRHGVQLAAVNTQWRRTHILLAAHVHPLLQGYDALAAGVVGRIARPHAAHRLGSVGMAGSAALAG